MRIFQTLLFTSFDAFQSVNPSSLKQVNKSTINPPSQKKTVKLANKILAKIPPKEEARTDGDADLVKDGGTIDKEGHYTNGPHEDTTHTAGATGTMNKAVETVKDTLITDKKHVKETSYERGNGEGDLPPSGTPPPAETKAEKEKSEAEVDREKKVAKVQKAIEEVNGAPAMPHPEPVSYLTSSCEKICGDQCTPTGIMKETSDRLDEEKRLVHGIVPDPILEGAYSAGKYVTDVLGEAIPIFGLLQQKKSKKLIKSSFQQKHQERKLFTSSTDCLVSCQNLVNQCADHIDIGDAIPQQVEKWEVAPRIAECEDLQKLHFIAQSGNLKWSLKFGQSPTFNQIAGLVEPLDLITPEDLEVLGKCAEGGDFASLNVAKAKQVGECIAGETSVYARELEAHVREAEKKVHKKERRKMKKADIIKGGSPEETAKAVKEEWEHMPDGTDAVPAPKRLLLEMENEYTSYAQPSKLLSAFQKKRPAETLEQHPLMKRAVREADTIRSPADKERWEIPEEAFYIEDMRCFSSCPQIKFNDEKLLKRCKRDQNGCQSDFIDLLWRTGALSSENTIGKALHEMQKAHAEDPAKNPPSGKNIFNPLTWFGDQDKKWMYDNTEATDYIIGFFLNLKEPEAEPKFTYDPAFDATSPLFAPEIKGASRPAKFCKPQMCAPFPAYWMGKDSEVGKELRKSGVLGQCDAFGDEAPQIERELEPGMVEEEVMMARSMGMRRSEVTRKSALAAVEKAIEEFNAI